MVTRRLGVGLLVAGVLLAVCGEGSDLEAAEARWAEAGIDDYTLTVHYACFCLRERTGPFEVTVSGGVVVEIRFDGEVIEPTPGLTPVDVFTVEGLFAEIRDNAGADRLTVEYDDIGVPIRIDIDQIERAVDDELTITVSYSTP